MKTHVWNHKRKQYKMSGKNLQLSGKFLQLSGKVLLLSGKILRFTNFSNCQAKTYRSTFLVYRVGPELVQRHIFDFRFYPQTGSELFFINRKFKISEPDVKNIPDRKRIKFQVVSKISVWWYFEQGWRQRLLKNFAPYV